MKKTIIIIGITLFLGFCLGVNINKFIKTDNTIKDSRLFNRLALYINNEDGEYVPSIMTSFPKKQDGYIYQKYECDNGGTITQNEDESFNLLVSKSDRCKLYFDKLLVKTLLNRANDVNVSTYTANSEESKQMYMIKHESNSNRVQIPSEHYDYRFIGASPNNWINFNGETWRIIGVFTDADGKQKVKIMSSVVIENVQFSINDPRTNYWIEAILNNYLNGEYYNNISETLREKISLSTWYLGGGVSSNDLKAEDYYNFERGNITCLTVGKCSGERKISSENYIGLIYPSDYVYTFSNGVNNTCFNSAYDCHNSDKKTDSWMYNVLRYQNNFTITPYHGENRDNLKESYVYLFHKSGYINFNYNYNGDGTSNYLSIHPVLYLDSDVKYISGDGSQSSPYIL